MGLVMKERVKPSGVYYLWAMENVSRSGTTTAYRKAWIENSKVTRFVQRKGYMTPEDEAKAKLDPSSVFELVLGKGCKVRKYNPSASDMSANDWVVNG